MKLIKIPEELRDYIERLNYEEVRYKDFLNLVTKDGMTNEEWDSSFEYYARLRQEAILAKNFMIDELREIYKNEIDSENWYIDFRKSAICMLYENEILNIY